MDKNSGWGEGHLSSAELRYYRSLAQKHEGHQSAKIIHRLLDVLQTYRTENNVLRATAAKSNSFDDDTLMPFGQYKGEPLCEVPDDYLHWFLAQNNRDALWIDAQFEPYPRRAVAIMKMKLVDYANGRLNKDEETHED